MNNHIKKMLRITDEHLDLTNTEEYKIKGKNTLVIFGVYSPMPSACRNCGSTIVDNEGKSVVVRNGKKEVTIQLDSYQNMPGPLSIK